MKTDKQISNAHSRASALAWEVAQQSQQALRGDNPTDLANERGGAQCAAGFAAQALAKLENGDYEGFLSSMRLAGKFAEETSEAFYARKIK